MKTLQRFFHHKNADLRFFRQRRVTPVLARVLLVHLSDEQHGVVDVQRRVWDDLGDDSGSAVAAVLDDLIVLVPHDVRGRDGARKNPTREIEIRSNVQERLLVIRDDLSFAGNHFDVDEFLFGGRVRVEMAFVKTRVAESSVADLESGDGLFSFFANGFSRVNIAFYVPFSLLTSRRFSQNPVENKKAFWI